MKLLQDGRAIAQVLATNFLPEWVELSLPSVCLKRREKVPVRGNLCKAGTDPVHGRFHPIDHLEQRKTMESFASAAQQLGRGPRLVVAKLEFESAGESPLSLDFLVITQPDLRR